jgi:hypothetical protein
VPPSHFLEEVLVYLLARTQYRKFAAHVHHVLKDILDKVYTLVGNKSCNDTDNRLVALLEVKLVQQSLFALRLALEIFYGKILCQQRILFRIERVNIDTVKETAELILLVNERSVQTVGVPWVEDFPCVAGGYCCDLIGAFKRAFHQVHAAVVFQQLCVIHRYAQYLIEYFHAVFALILDIMDSEYGFDVVVTVLIFIEHVIVNGNKRGLPVVAVDYLGLPADVLKHFHYSTGQEHKALTVIIKAVETVSAEVVFVVQQIVYNTVHLALEHAAVLSAPAHVNGKVGDKFEGRTKLRLNVFVQGKNHAAVLSGIIESAGKRTRNVGKSARSGIRNSFRRRI